MEGQGSFIGRQAQRVNLPPESPRSPRGKEFHKLLRGLAKLDRVRGGLIVAPDGFVIASDLPQGIAVEPLAALAATLGRELEVGAARLKRGAFQMALFSADDGTVFLGASPVGFLVVLGDRDVNVGMIRVGLRRAMDAVQETWGASRPSAQGIGPP